MKKKKKVEFCDLKIGKCFRATKNGLIYMKNNMFGSTNLIGKQKGQLFFPVPNKKITVVKIKIEEVK